jgi:hypothetical protein
MVNLFGSLNERWWKRIVVIEVIVKEEFVRVDKSTRACEGC